MSRAMNVRMSADDIALGCGKADVGISNLEALPGGGNRLVCQSTAGAENMRRRFKSKLMRDDLPRHPLTSRR